MTGGAAVPAVLLPVRERGERERFSVGGVDE